MSKQRKSRGKLVLIPSAREIKPHRDKSSSKSRKRQNKNQLDASAVCLLQGRLQELEQTVDLRLKTYDNIIKEKFDVQETKIKTMAKLVSLIQELVDSKFSNDLFLNPKEDSYNSDPGSHCEQYKNRIQNELLSICPMEAEKVWNSQGKSSRDFDKANDGGSAELQRNIAELQKKAESKFKRIEDTLEAMSLAETHMNFIKEVHHLK